jgi:predicted transcriptional regulator
MSPEEYRAKWGLAKDYPMVAPNYAKARSELAKSMGWWAKGPIKDPAQLASALKEAVAVVKSGHPALLNVWTQPR